MNLNPEETLVLKSQNLSLFEDLKKGKKSISVIKGTITTKMTLKKITFDKSKLKSIIQDDFTTIPYMQ